MLMVLRVMLVDALRLHLNLPSESVGFLYFCFGSSSI